MAGHFSLVQLLVVCWYASALSPAHCQRFPTEGWLRCEPSWTITVYGKDKLFLLERQPCFLWVEVLLSQGDLSYGLPDWHSPQSFTQLQSLRNHPGKAGWVGSWWVPKAETDPICLSSSAVSESSSQLVCLILMLLLMLVQRQFWLSLGVRWVILKPTFATLQESTLKQFTGFSSDLFSWKSGKVF